MPKIILDCDPGHDDAVAIMMAAKHPDVELLGITTVAGNQTLDKTTRNALHVLQHLELDVPVARGAEKPMIAQQVIAEDIHGQSGLDGPTFAPLTRDVESLCAIDFIAQQIRQSDEPVVLVPTGPLTNIALLLQSKPWVKEKISKIVLMGGAIGLGNVTPAAEFNIYVDPEAAAIVFRAGIPLVMMGLDLTRQALATGKVVDHIRRQNTKASQLFVDMMEFFASTQREVFGWTEGPPVHDPTTIAYLIDPTLIETKEVAVEIDVSHGPSYGRTLCDMFGITGKKPNCRVATKLNFDGFWELVSETIKLY